MREGEIAKVLSRAGGARRLVVASYNVHGFVGTDGRPDAARVGRVLAELAADVVALQEVRGVRRGAGDVDRLADALGLHVVSGPMLERGEATHGNALLARWPPTRVERIDLSLTGFEPRGAIDASYDVEGGPLRVVATHLGTWARERRLQAQRLALHLGAAPARVRVLLGDMNEWVRGAGALLPLHRRLGRTPGPRTFPAPFPLFSLDRIWVDPRAQMRRLWVHRSREARFASDHLPIVAEIDLGEAPARERARSCAPRRGAAGSRSSRARAGGSPARGRTAARRPPNPRSPSMRSVAPPEPVRRACRTGWRRPSRYSVFRYSMIAFRSVSVSTEVKACPPLPWPYM